MIARIEHNHCLDNKQKRKKKHKTILKNAALEKIFQKKSKICLFFLIKNYKILYNIHIDAWFLQKHRTNLTLNHLSKGSKQTRS